jgi:hypothetical protein
VIALHRLRPDALGIGYRRMPFPWYQLPPRALHGDDRRPSFIALATGAFHGADNTGPHGNPTGLQNIPTQNCGARRTAPTRPARNNLPQSGLALPAPTSFIDHAGAAMEAALKKTLDPNLKAHWQMLHADYVMAHGEYLRLKLQRDAAQGQITEPNSLLNAKTHLAHAHEALHQFCQKYAEYC